MLTNDLVFPPPALAQKDGLLAVGGDLSVERLLLAYQMGIFPWYSEDVPLLWWSPDPRLVLYPDELHVSKSLQKVIKKGIFQITMDTAFRQVMTACAQIDRPAQDGTWILDEMIEAYCRLHEVGYAHSVEVWHNRELAGGLYGISLGRCFFGESMFSRQSNASKVALYSLVTYIKQFQFDLIDCQVTTDHLVRLGAREIPRAQFLSELADSLRHPTIKGKWTHKKSPRVRVGF
jgi:leucyl/phenylalanyl-tRNA--protein transferase